jgi:fucose permease
MTATIVAITSVFGLGVAFSLLGSIKLRLTERLKIDDAQMGKLISTFMFSCLIFVLVAGLLRDKFGYQAVAILGFAAGALAVFLLGRAGSYGMAAGACLLLGIGAMFMNTAGNTLLAEESVLFKEASRSSNLGNVFFGVGAFIVPLLTVWLFRKTSYAATLGVLALIILAPVIFAIVGTFPEPTGSFSLTESLKLLTQQQVILGALLLLCYIGLEVSMGGWITTYIKGIGGAETKASAILSGFWIALMVGRILTALVLGNLLDLDKQGPWLILVLSLAAAGAIYAMVCAKGVSLGGFAVILTGFCFGPIFPTVVGVTLSRTQPELLGSAFSAIFAVGLIGAMFVPAWIGSMSKGKSIQASMRIAAGTALVLSALALITGVLA